MRKLITPVNIASPPANILTHLGFRTYLPHPHLQSWIQCYWTVQHPQLPAQGFNEKLYPDGGTNINFCFIPNQLPLVSFNAVQTLKTMHFQGSVDLLGIRFHPGGAFQLFALDMPMLIGKVIATDDLESALNNSQLQELREQLAQSDNKFHRLGLIDNWLLQQAAHQLAKSGPVQHLLPLLATASESIETLSARINISRRQLERRFQQEVGLTLVHLKQLQRCRRARQLISLNPHSSLTDIAQEAGFYDQAHFIRQFQKVHQLTPGEYRDKKLAQALTKPTI
jgi:AraC-like DNA-binding protein